MHWQQEGKDPDYRFSLANERTFLAWIRTALAILAGAILLHQVQTSVAPTPWSAWAGSAVAAVAAGVGLSAYVRWRANEIAMRHDRSLPRARLIPFMALVVALMGAGAALALLLRG